MLAARHFLAGVEEGFGVCEFAFLFYSSNAEGVGRPALLRACTVLPSVCFLPSYSDLQYSDSAIHIVLSFSICFLSSYGSPGLRPRFSWDTLRLKYLSIPLWTVDLRGRV